MKYHIPVVGGSHHNQLVRVLRDFEPPCVRLFERVQFKWEGVLNEPDKSATTTIIDYYLQTKFLYKDSLEVRFRFYAPSNYEPTTEELAKLIIAELQNQDLSRYVHDFTNYRAF